MVQVGCGGCHTMVLGCRRQDQEHAKEDSIEEDQDVKLSSTSARNRRRLLDVSILSLLSCFMITDEIF